MKPAIVGVTDDGVVFGPDATTLTRWALATHIDECPQCRRGDELCPTGQRIDDATRPDSSWIPSPRTGA